jgi:hypothetical protein
MRVIRVDRTFMSIRDRETIGQNADLSHASSQDGAIQFFFAGLLAYCYA